MAGFRNRFCGACREEFHDLGRAHRPDPTRRNRQARFAVAALTAVFLVGLLQPRATAQTAEPADRAIVVGLYISPPFVMEKDGGYTGMAFELWEAAADHLGLQSDYRTYPTVGELVQAVADGDVAVGVTNLTITQKRAESIDFTQPWFDAGLRIMIYDASGANLRELIAGLRDSGFLTAYAWLGFVILAATVVSDVLRPAFRQELPGALADGIAESFYTVMSVTTTGRPPSRKNLFGWVGRLWQGIWLVCGIAVVAYVTSSVTSVMTTLSLTNQIASLNDLPGKLVGVLSGSTSELFARSEGLDFRTFADIDTLAAALRDEDIDAAIGDAPVLEYHAHTHPDDRFDVVGAIFEPDKYGFGLTRGNPLTKPLTLELLGAHETDAVDGLRIKYFGEDP